LEAAREGALVLGFDACLGRAADLFDFFEDFAAAFDGFEAGFLAPALDLLTPFGLALEADFGFGFGFDGPFEFLAAALDLPPVDFFETAFGFLAAFDGVLALLTLLALLDLAALLALLDFVDLAALDLPTAFDPLDLVALLADLGFDFAGDFDFDFDLVGALDLVDLVALDALFVLDTLFALFALVDFLELLEALEFFEFFGDFDCFASDLGFAFTPDFDLAFDACFETLEPFELFGAFEVDFDFGFDLDFETDLGLDLVATLPAPVFFEVALEAAFEGDLDLVDLAEVDDFFEPFEFFEARDLALVFLPALALAAFDGLADFEFGRFELREPDLGLEFFGVRFLLAALFFFEAVFALAELVGVLDFFEAFEAFEDPVLAGFLAFADLADWRDLGDACLRDLSVVDARDFALSAHFAHLVHEPPSPLRLRLGQF
jgi:hypothetical protein